MIELAIFLPIVLLLIAGIVDMGFSINRVKSVISASRQAAKIAASHSRSLSSATSCGTSVQMPCVALTPLTASASVTDIAAHAACAYLEQNSPPREGWFVDIGQPSVVVEDGSAFMTVTADVRYTGRTCYICIHHLVTSFEPRSRSTFVLEAPCQS